MTDSRKRWVNIAVVVVLVPVLGVTTYLLLFVKWDNPKVELVTVDTSPGAAVPRGIPIGAMPTQRILPLQRARPAPTVVRPPGPPTQRQWKIAGLRSPATSGMAAGSDPQTNKLIDQHNARLTSLSSIRFAASCSWSTPDNSRPMTIRYDFATDLCGMRCSTDSCSIDADAVNISDQSAMQVDALYAILFRRFNPKDFPAAATQTLIRQDPGGKTASLSVLATQAKDESLYFDPATGLLLRATVNSDYGPITADFDNYSAASSQKITFPLSVRLEVPAKLSPGGGPIHPHLTIDPTSMEMQLAATR